MGVEDVLVEINFYAIQLFPQAPSWEKGRGGGGEDRRAIDSANLPYPSRKVGVEVQSGDFRVAGNVENALRPDLAGSRDNITAEELQCKAKSQPSSPSRCTRSIRYHKTKTGKMIVSIVK